LRARLQKHGIRFLERDDRPPGAIELRHSHREAFFTTVSRDARPTGRRGWG
jgi:hypothetical protein